MGVREQRRLATEAEILRVARAHLTRYGAAALSLRAIARELGMVSSGIYRYVDSREELLTRLIIRAYTSLAEAVTRAHDAVDPADLDARWDAIGNALHAWALANPQDFALVYGSPVPDYTAPAERTTGPGTAVLALLTRLLDEACRAGRVPRSEGDEHGALEAAGAFLDDDEFFAGTSLDAEALARGLSAWTLLLGAVTSDVFHQLGPVPDTRALFAWHLARARELCLTPASSIESR
ncbi:TetR/AcrR family transcriptional regulator [Intrasporangium sp.]|uniref:TetR/AcrR family transcriptional regulator n=1 Tax=Intrasporangium sp. TaxID=1925024 RepID=UPI00293962C5|nr:TetR/AcrR family transcriptional regulator [Intrasporangium sp.]MDV3219980.1 TetR/AcrR family transcriptional regulator [Intrasporangium sp.]